MGVNYGYGKLAGTDSLVFAYDAGDMRNSFKGKPAANILTAMSYSYGERNDALFKTHYGLEDVYIPAIGRTTAHFCEVYNDYNGGSGNCCLSLFGYGGDIRTGVVGGATYTYQIIYRTTTGYAHPNYMYQYQYSDSGYITEYGLWSNSREEDLGDGWKHAWGTFTLNAATTRLYCYLFHYEYATYNKVQVAGVMLTQGSTIYRPHQFFPYSNSISNTQGLLDLTGNSTLNLSNVSFDTNGQMTFDGTDDYIDIPSASWNILTTHTLEAVFKANGAPTNGFHVMFQKEGGYSGGSVYGLRANPGSQLYAMICYDAQAASQNTLGSSTTLVDGQWYHVTATFDSGYNWKLYINGVLENQNTLTGNPYQNSSSITIGQGDGRKTNGNIPVMKIYNRALTAQEVASNYNHYKSRFNI